MVNIDNLTHERLLAVLRYDPITGKFTWLVRKSRRTHPGSEAGYITPEGYVEISLDGENYKAHRLAWFYMTGEWPKKLTDHKDNVRWNNRWSNLREADNAQNSRNSRRRSDNQSRLKGVVLRPRGWKAHITINGKQTGLGFFPTAEEAHEAYVAAAKLHYGEFARAA